MNRAVFFLLAPLLVACAGGKDVTSKQLEDMRVDLVKLRADNAALAERLDTLELTRGGLRGSSSAQSSSSSDRPNLDVVKLGPDNTDDEADEVDEGGRPVLKSTGSGSVVEEPGVKGAPNATAQKEYDQSLELYRSKQFDKALDGFASFLVKYPDNANAESATFWRGECYYARGEYRRAAEQFEAVSTKFPKGSKAPDALFKLAQSYGKLAEGDSSEQAKKKLLATYPTSDAARKLRASAKKP